MTTTTMTRIEALETELNEMILSGKAMDALEKFYDDEIVMQENDEAPYIGKEFNRKREEEFFASIEDVHALRLDGWAASDDISFSEWTYDLTFKGGARVKWSQASVRRWKDGKVVSERFYHKTLG